MKERLHQERYSLLFEEFIAAIDSPHSHQQALDQFKASNVVYQAHLPSRKALTVARELADMMDRAIKVFWFFFTVYLSVYRELRIRLHFPRGHQMNIRNSYAYLM